MSGLAGAKPPKPYFEPDLFQGVWVVSRYQDVALALRDPRLSVARTGDWLHHPRLSRRALSPLRQLVSQALLFLDPPEHTELRGLISPGLLLSTLEGLRADLDRELDRRLQQIQASLHRFGEVDLVAELARPVPIWAIARVMGLGHAQTEGLLAQSSAISGLLASPRPSETVLQAAQAALVRLSQELRPILAARRTHRVGSTGSEPDLLSRIALGVADPDRAIAQASMLLFAGAETSRHLLANLMVALAQRPSQPEEAPGLVREVLRLHPPVQYTLRRVAAPLQIAGQEMAVGQAVLLHLGRANRDPRKFDQPDALEPDRTQGPALSFGLGLHACIGAALSRLEGEALVKAVCRQKGALHEADLHLAPHDESPSGLRLYDGPSRLVLRLR